MKCFQRLLMIAFSLASGLGLANSAYAGQIYWTTGQGIERANLDGTGRQMACVAPTT